MNHFARSVSFVLLLGSAAATLAQAPIVRQPPSDSVPAYGTPDGQEPPPPAQPAYNPDQQYPQQPQSYPSQPAYAPPDQPGQPPLLAPQQLDQLVGRIALYPDPLLAQTLTASTNWEQIPVAAQWADQHAYLKGDTLNGAIQADNLQMDPSVLALLPFPSVLDMLAGDPNWTSQLGTAVLAQRNDVMDAVQRLRHQARGYGYLNSTSDVDVIDQGGYIEIQPYNPYLYYVPVYSPVVVFGPPRPGVFVGGVVRWGPAVTLGVSFGRFGWFGAGFGWSSHVVYVDHRPWVRTYANRAVYVHPYAHPYVRPAAPSREEHHAPPPHEREGHNHR